MKIKPTNQRKWKNSTNIMMIERSYYKQNVCLFCLIQQQHREWNGPNPYIILVEKRKKILFSFQIYCVWSCFVIRFFYLVFSVCLIILDLVKCISTLYIYLFILFEMLDPIGRWWINTWIMNHHHHHDAHRKDESHKQTWVPFEYSWFWIWFFHCFLVAV